MSKDRDHEATSRDEDHAAKGPQGGLAHASGTRAERAVLDARAALDQARGLTPEDPEAVAAASKALADAEVVLAEERNPPPAETKGPAERTPPT